MTSNFPHGIYVVEFESSPVRSRWVVIAADADTAGQIVADRVMPNSTVERRNAWAEGLEVSRIGTYGPGPRGSRFPAIVAIGTP